MDGIGLAFAHKESRSKAAIVPPRGVAHISKTPGNIGILGPQRARVGAVSERADDPDLQLLVERWPKLAEPIKAGIMAIVRASEA